MRAGRTDRQAGRERKTQETELVSQLVVALSPVNLKDYIRAEEDFPKEIHS